MSHRNGKASNRIFIVDNDEGMRNSIKRLLDLHGLDVVAFSSAEELLMEPDPACSCYLLDIDLEVISGIDLYRRLKTIGRNAPVVYMTGSDDERTRLEAEKTGYTGYLIKPFSANALLQAVRDCAAASAVPAS